MTRVLLIEDDEGFAEILKESLEDDGEMQIAKVIGSESEAMQFFKSGGLQDIQCILLDLQLPTVPHASHADSRAGLRILEEVRLQQRFYGTIVVLTNSRAPEDGQRALAAGCDGYLCKHAPVEHIPRVVSELKMAIEGEVVMVSSEMRHVFFREDISAKEARLMDMLVGGASWADVARDLNYKTSKAAANIGDRVFDKLLTLQEREKIETEGRKKRDVAIDIWKSRHAAQV